MLAWAVAVGVFAVIAATALALLGRTVARSRSHRARWSAEAAVAASRLRSVVDTVAEPILIVDGDGKITLANRSAGQLFAAPAEELAACHIEQLVPTFRGGPGPHAGGGGSPPSTSSDATLSAFRRDGRSFQARVDSAGLGDDGSRIVVVRDLAAARAGRPLLAQQAVRDSLTGLPSEQQLRDRLRDRVEQAAGRRAPFSLFVLDLDGFAEVNQRFGHGVGDRLIAAVGERLRQTLRTTDLVARLGGDDFAVVPGGGATPASSARIARQVLAALRKPFVINGRSVEISASLGIAHYPDHGEDADLLMVRAEAARVAAKRARRGWAVYRPDDDATELEDRAVRLGELRRAIDNQELELFYQPVVRVADSALVGLDASVRWRHRRLGLLEPDQFVRIAEQSEIIRPLTRCILGLAVEQQAAWREQGHALRVAVTLAGRNAQDRQLPRVLAGLLERWRVPTSAVCVTIDENTRLPARSPVLQSLAEAGHVLAVDNYGSESSALLRLRDLPFTELRLDPALVSTLREEGGDLAAVRDLVEMAHALGLSVIARGVDHDTTLSALQRLGCDSAQGRLWGEPVPAGAVIPLLRLLARQSRFPGLGRYRSPQPAGGSAAPGQAEDVGS
jgi:diguanylate cyclase (GGDEF)-like protein